MSRRQVDQTVTPLAMGTSEDPTQFGDDTDSDEDDDSTIDEEKAEGVKEEGEEEEEEDSMNFWHRRWSCRLLYVVVVLIASLHRQSRCASPYNCCGSLPRQIRGYIPVLQVPGGRVLVQGCSGIGCAVGSGRVSFHSLVLLWESGAVGAYHGADGAGGVCR